MFSYIPLFFPDGVLTAIDTGACVMGLRSGIGDPGSLQECHRENVDIDCHHVTPTQRAHAAKNEPAQATSDKSSRVQVLFHYRILPS